MREIFPEGTIIPTFRRPKALKEFLAPSCLKPVNNYILNDVENGKANFNAIENAIFVQIILRILTASLVLHKAK